VAANETLPGAEAEAFRLVRTRLRYFNVDRELRSLLVTSASPSEGKTTVAFYLARTAAEAGIRTLLIEADLHEAALASEFGLSPLPGLAEVLTRQASPEGVIQGIPLEEATNGHGGGRGLDVIVAGAEAPNPLELMESGEMARLLAHLGTSYDLVVLDTPPAGSVADALPLLRLVSGVLLVAQLGKTTRDEAVSLREQLDSMEVSALGVVLNRARRRRGYGYGAPHGYGSEAHGGRRIGRRRPRRGAQRPRLAPPAPAPVDPGPNGQTSEELPLAADPPATPDHGVAELNDATAEDLEELGLPASQAYRILAHRERIGAFLSLEELEEVPELSDNLAAILRARLLARG